MSTVVRFPFRHRLITFLRDLDVKGVRNIAHRLPHLILPKPKGDMIIETLHGFKLIIDPVKDQGVENVVYYTGTYERGTMDLLSCLLKPGDCFVDVGANIGLMTVHAARIVGMGGHVYAFEPNIETHRLLQQNIKLNDLRCVELSTKALGAASSAGVLYDRWESSRGSASMVSDGKESTGLPVVISTLDIEIQAGQRVDLLKMDIEGYELEALKGAQRLLSAKDAPMLIVECSVDVDPRHPELLFRKLRSINKYRIFKALGGKERKSRLVEIVDEKMLPKHDNIIAITEAHLKHLPVWLFKSL